jgi:hypothetical protein
MPQLKHFKDKVRDVLSRHPKTRNNDHRLLAQYVYDYRRSLVSQTADGEPCVKLADFEKMPPSQTLVNNRKIIQNHEGEYLPTDPKVRRARQIKDANINNAEWREAKNA